ncbi:peptidase inhibitor family I36 protein [Amycolatopsis sp. cmx-11-51]|uniref:peptidase inhibitor family I36 protein n=1 Tax=unclassified Amycolatopsis TaxID=2618356 RepID=UPI0039E2B46B
MIVSLGTNQEVAKTEREQMSIFKKSLGVAVITLATMAGTVTAADAATGYDRCPAGHMCLFAGDDGQGAMAFFQVGSPDLSAQNFDDRTRSWNNRNSGSFCMYVNKYYDNSAGAGTFQPGTKGNVAEFNRYSSLRRC